MLRKRLFELGLLVALLAGLMFSASLPAQAQSVGTGDPDEDTVTVAFPGFISIGDNGIWVDGVKVAPASAFEPSDYEDGECVFLTGVVLDSDVVQATDLRPCTDDEATDTDEDGVLDATDNCPNVSNPDQANMDDDELGDACDDSDDDGIVDAADSCPYDVNLGVDTDGDGIDDACDTIDNSGDQDNQDQDQDQEMEGCTNGNHPVLSAYAGEFEDFGITYEDLEAWHCDGMGLGEIGRALLLAEANGDVLGYSDILDARAGGDSWGQIKKDNDIDPSKLAPGRIISGHHQTEETTQTQQSVAPGNSGSHGNSGNNPGHGGNPPGQDKNKDNGKSNQEHGKKK